MITGINNNTSQRQNFGMAVKTEDDTYKQIFKIAQKSPRKANRMLNTIDLVSQEQVGNVLYDMPIRITKDKLDFSIKAKQNGDGKHAKELEQACKSFFLKWTGASDLKKASECTKRESDKHIATLAKIKARRGYSHNSITKAPGGQWQY